MIMIMILAVLGMNVDEHRIDRVWNHVMWMDGQSECFVPMCCRSSPPSFLATSGKSKSGERVVITRAISLMLERLLSTATPLVNRNAHSHWFVATLSSARNAVPL
ncbi:hypothetical protein TMatcc_009661 [Talaromyces marneffei ATCC 18224]